MGKSGISAALQQARRKQETYLEGFKTLLRFPSISQDDAFQPQLRACADWIAAEMTRIGLDNVQILETAGNPIIYADWLRAGAEKPTLLFYAHYDVQPVGDAALWTSPAFEPTIAGGRLVARGTVDDKCGIWINLKAIEAILSACGDLPINIKLFFEGEEELGSKHVGPFVAANKDLLAADAIIISDGPFSPQQPVIGYALRGAIVGELRVGGPPHDLHSGRYGGAVKNPIHHLSRIIASLHDAEGRVTIKGFYDGALRLDDQQRRDLNEAWKTVGPPLEAAAGVSAFFGEDLGSFAERTTSMPTLDINGVTGGYQGTGTRAIIPAKAVCKVTIRTVAGQDADAIWARFVEHVMAYAEPGIKIEAALINVAHPVLMSDSGREIRAIQRALQAALGKQALLVRHGGSLPIGGTLGRELGVPVTMLGYGSGDNSHAPNEFIYLDDIPLATEVAIRLLFELGRDGALED